MSSTHRRFFGFRFALVSLLTVFWISGTSATFAQTYTVQPDSKIWVDGTSNKSDFTVHATKIDAAATLGSDTAAPTALEITVPSSEIKSNESTIMDRLMHEALKVSEHPTITYELTGAEASAGSTLRTTGKLTLAGVTKEVAMDVKAEKAANGGMRFTGSTPLKMSDYGIQPPVAMFGALRTADDVTVGFDVVFVPAK